MNKKIMYRKGYSQNEVVPVYCEVIDVTSQNEPIITLPDAGSMVSDWEDLYNTYDDCLDACVVAEWIDDLPRVRK